MARHYHAGMNVPGYLPDSDVLTFETKDDAIAYADALRANLEDDGDYPYACEGGDGDYLCYRTGVVAAMALHIWVDECDDDDCEVDQDA